MAIVKIFDVVLENGGVFIIKALGRWVPNRPLTSANPGVNVACSL